MEEDFGIVKAHDGCGEDECEGDFSLAIGVEGQHSQESHDAGAYDGGGGADEDGEDDDGDGGHIYRGFSTQGSERGHEDGDEDGDVVAGDGDDVCESGDFEIFRELFGDAFARAE